jgi:hypothetical protein
MQLTPRYLVSNRTFLIADDTGFIVEYNPVYKRQLQIYKGIQNVLEFQLLNADQKPIDITKYLISDSTNTPTIVFTAFDENKRKVIEHQGEIIFDDDSAINRGLFQVVITENDLLNLKDQYLSYNVYLQDDTGLPRLTYADSHFGMEGTIKLSSEAFPGPQASHSVTNFTKPSPDTTIEEWYSDPVSAQPGINGNEALHTVAIYTEGYNGDVTVEATLENLMDGNEAQDWAEIDTVSFDGSSEIEPVPVNFNGVYSYLRFKTNADPADTITKILVRN